MTIIVSAIRRFHGIEVPLDITVRHCRDRIAAIGAVRNYFHGAVQVISTRGNDARRRPQHAQET